MVERSGGSVQEIGGFLDAHEMLSGIGYAGFVALAFVTVIATQRVGST